MTWKIQLINFEIYIDEKYKGYDLFIDSEYDYLMSILKKNFYLGK